MGENTKIEWATHTWSPWVGCTKISPACDHCYAASWAKRTGSPKLWGGDRRRTSADYWQKPIKWNLVAEKAGERPRVFPSLCDPFDNQVPRRWRDDMWHRIDQTPYLDWLLLTKRPQNIAKMLPDPRTGIKTWGEGWPNVWLGTTVEDMERARYRLPALQAVPAKVHFVSAEPLLGELQLRRIPIARGIQFDALTGRYEAFTSMLGGFDRAQEAIAALPNLPKPLAPIDWVICGGESGRHARPMHPDWARSLRDQCRSVGAAFHFKQWGEWASVSDDLPSELQESYEISGRLLDGMIRVGKRAAGRLLDGREWNDVPEVAYA